jgi:hypothetical protein
MFSIKSVHVKRSGRVKCEKLGRKKLKKCLKMFFFTGPRIFLKKTVVIFGLYRFESMGKKYWGKIVGLLNERKKIFLRPASLFVDLDPFSSYRHPKSSTKNIFFNFLGFLHRKQRIFASNPKLFNNFFFFLTENVRIHQ